MFFLSLEFQRFSFQRFSFWELVVPRGNAPRSSAYQAGALLLSYETGLDFRIADCRLQI